MRRPIALALSTMLAAVVGTAATAEAVGGGTVAHHSSSSLEYLGTASNWVWGTASWVNVTYSGFKAGGATMIRRGYRTNPFYDTSAYWVPPHYKAVDATTGAVVASGGTGTGRAIKVPDWQHPVIALKPL